MKKFMMLTLVLSVMAMGSAMANDNCADKKPKKRDLPPMSLLVPPPPPVHHCCDCNIALHHKCDKGDMHRPKGVHFDCNHGGPNKRSKCGKAGDNCPPRGKEHKPIKGDKGGKSGRRCVVLKKRYRI